MILCVLGSGSKGNSLFIGRAGRGVIVDAGLSCREVLRRMEAVGIDPGWVEAIVVTHEHADHITGLRALARTLGVAVAATAGTWQAIGRIKGLQNLCMVPGQEIMLGGMRIRPFSVVHDAAEPVGVVVATGSCRVGVATDMGLATRLVLTRLAGCDALVVEANHDPAMLAAGAYPPQLKQRIASTHGHLSNPAAARMLARLAHPGLRHIVLAHLSQHNNRPDLARACVERLLHTLNPRPQLLVASQDQPTRVLEL